MGFFGFVCVQGMLIIAIFMMYHTRGGSIVLTGVCLAQHLDRL